MNENQVSIPPENKKPFPDMPISQNSQVLNRPIILGDLTLSSPTTQTTIGANGAASALTANPLGYITIIVGNLSVIVPYYNP